MKWKRAYMIMVDREECHLKEIAQLKTKIAELERLVDFEDSLGILDKWISDRFTPVI